MDNSKASKSGREPVQKDPSIGVNHEEEIQNDPSQVERHGDKKKVEDEPLLKQFKRIQAYLNFCQKLASAALVSATDFG